MDCTIERKSILVMRRMTHHSISKESIVDTQPMIGMSGLVDYLRLRFGGKKKDEPTKVNWKLEGF